jgi:ribonuclease J
MAERKRETLNFWSGRSGSRFSWVSSYAGRVVGLCSYLQCPEGCRDRLGADFRGGLLEVDLELRPPYGARLTEFYLAHVVRRVTSEAQTAMSASSLAAGGLAESDGTGLTAICYVDQASGESLIVDCGMPPGQNGGTVETLRRLLAEPGLRGVAITHAHFDHWSLVSEVDQLPVFVEELTASYIDRQVEQSARQMARNGIPAVPPFRGAKDRRSYTPGTTFEVGGFKIHAMPVAHSIPDASMFLIETPSGKRVLHLGECKFNGMDDWRNRLMFELQLKEIGQRGVDLMYCDNLNAHAAGFTPEEDSAVRSVAEIIARAEGRVVVAMFASNLSRLRVLAAAARDFGRPTLFEGNSMTFAHEILYERGYDLPPGGEPMEKTVVFATGCQAEEWSVLDREVTKAGNGRPQLWLHGGDTVVFSSRAIPGNEPRVKNLVERLLKRGCAVVLHEGEVAKLGLAPNDRLVERFVHVSGHGSAEDLRLALELVRPKRVVPSVRTSPQIEAFREIAASQSIEVVEAADSRIVL